MLEVGSFSHRHATFWNSSSCLLLNIGLRHFCIGFTLQGQKLHILYNLCYVFLYCRPWSSTNSSSAAYVCRKSVYEKYGKKTEFICGQVGYCLYSRGQFKHNGVKWSLDCLVNRAFIIQILPSKNFFFIKHHRHSQHFLTSGEDLVHVWALFHHVALPVSSLLHSRQRNQKAGKSSCDLDLSVYVASLWWRPAVCFVAHQDPSLMQRHHGPSVDFPQGCFLFSPHFFFL